MKTLEKKMLCAVNSRKNARIGNTVVRNTNGVICVYLHGNEIYRNENGKESFCLCGWNTVTTRSRLNALGVDVRQKNWEPYYNGEIISVNGWHEV